MSFAGIAPALDPTHDTRWSFGAFTPAAIGGTDGEGHWTVGRLHWLNRSSGDRMCADPNDADRRIFPCSNAETALLNSHIAAPGAMGITLQQHFLLPDQFAWSLARAIADGLSAEDRGSLGGAFYALTAFMLGQASKNPAAWELGANSFGALPADAGIAMPQALRFMPAITLNMLCINQNEPRGAAFFVNASINRLTPAGRRSDDSSDLLTEIFESARCNRDDLQERIDENTLASHAGQLASSRSLSHNGAPRLK